MVTSTRAVLFDLDDTLVDTRELAQLRESRQWKQAVRQVAVTRLFAGIQATLAELDCRAIRWGVVTTSVSYYANAVLAHHGLDPAVVVAFHDATPKPSPASVTLALTRLSVRAECAIGIGDSEKDLSAYRSAGMLAVGAAWSATLAPVAWDVRIGTPSELLALLNARSP